MSDPFRILVVCTGNICRSPAGHLLLQHHLGDTVEVTSAGTHALVGQPVDPQMAALLPPGIGAEGFAARQLTPALLRDSDLVLAMTKEHRARAVELFPAAVRRSFTFRELARIVGLQGSFQPAATPAEFLRAAVPVAGKLRHRARAAEPGADDVVDPYRRDDSVFVAVHDQIDAAARDIARAAGVS